MLHDSILAQFNCNRFLLMHMQISSLFLSVTDVITGISIHSKMSYVTGLEIEPDTGAFAS